MDMAGVAQIMILGPVYIGPLRYPRFMQLRNNRNMLIVFPGGLGGGKQKAVSSATRKDVGIISL